MCHSIASSGAARKTAGIYKVCLRHESTRAFSLFRSGFGLLCGLLRLLGGRLDWGAPSLCLEALSVHRNLVDADLDEVLAVALHLLVLLLALQLEDQDLVAAAFAQHSARHLRAVQRRLKLALFRADGEHVGELNRAIGVRRALQLQRLTRGDDILLAAGTNYCIHSQTSCAAADGNPDRVFC